MFPILELHDRPEGYVYLNTAEEGLPWKTAADGLLSYARHKGNGALGRAHQEATEQECRERAAQLLRADIDDVALVSSTSEGVNSFVFSYPWSPGDEIIISDLEFPSNVQPWLIAAEKFGAVVKVLPCPTGEVVLEELLELVTQRTVIVSLSLVSFKTGGAVDVAAVRSVLPEHIFLGLDATQGLGVIPLDSANCDIAWSSSYKWLGGYHGVAIMFANRRLRSTLIQGPVGWKSVPGIFVDDRFEKVHYVETAQRFRLGSPNFPSIFALNNALKQVLELDQQAVLGHLETLRNKTLAGLDELGVEILTPRSEGQLSGIVSFSCDDEIRVAKQLEEAGIKIWGKDKRIRISFSVFNSESEIDSILEALGTILAK